MLMRLGAYPEDGAYFLTAALVPAVKNDATFFEYHTPERPPRVVPSVAGAIAISRFEFLAHLAPLGQSSLYRLDDILVAVRGFAGPGGWAFEHIYEDGLLRDVVRIATRSERDAEGTQFASKVERSRFVAEANRLRRQA